MSIHALELVKSEHVARRRSMGKVSDSERLRDLERDFKAVLKELMTMRKEKAALAQEVAAMRRGVALAASALTAAATLPSDADPFTQA